MIGKIFKYLVPLSLLLFILIIFGFSFVKVNASTKHPISIIRRNHINVCSRASGAYAGCNAKVVTDKSGAKPMATLSPTGYGPLQFNTAYNLPTNAPSGNPIIAIVDAYDNPNAYSDLNYYSSFYGIPNLPQCSGSIASSSVPCFKKINQTGGTSYPAVSSGWALESSLDVQVAHAICQNCKILLVEASSNSYSNLMTAINQAVSQGANVISNSYGSGEFVGETSYDSYLNHPGIAITFSSGDSGYGSGYPAASPFVTAVGGTTLQLNSDNTYFGETVWSGTGSGCSLYEPKPIWQTDSGCPNRTIADVSADADPSTGASVYDTTPYSGQTGWFQVGGTSLSAPLIAAVYAMSGVGSGVFANSVPYSNFASLRDVVSGNNGFCSPSYLCLGLAGYDGPTGLGSPNGLGGFGGTALTPTPTVTPTPTLTLTPTPTDVPIGTPSPTLIPTETPTVTPIPTVTLTPTPMPVSIIITNPVDGGTVRRSRRTTITTSVSANVAKVDFTVNGSLICSDSSSPFSCNWNVGRKSGVVYTISVIADGGTAGIASNSITVTSR